MRAQGVEGILLLQGFCGNPVGNMVPFNAAESISRFSRMFPDESNWIRRLAAEVHAEYAGELFSKLQYVGPPELFSMFACLYLSTDVVAHADVWAGGVERFAELVAEYSRRHGQPPHPNVLWELGGGGS